MTSSITLLWFLVTKIRALDYIAAFFWIFIGSKQTTSRFPPICTCIHANMWYIIQKAYSGWVHFWPSKATSKLFKIHWKVKGHC